MHKLMQIIPEEKGRLFTLMRQWPQGNISKITYLPRTTEHPHYGLKHHRTFSATGQNTTISNMLHYLDANPLHGSYFGLQTIFRS